jgi:hypothetical protein
MPWREPSFEKLEQLLAAVNLAAEKQASIDLEKLNKLKQILDAKMKLKQAQGESDVVPQGRED